ncbi:MAG: AsmA family protein [Acidobacteria bacterium]|nr:AsmA family protein [Acidobacteriota bacterium]
MKRKLLIVLGAIVALLVVAAAALPFLLDVERYRPSIEGAIAGATGRAVTIGPMRLTFFPAAELTAVGFSIGEDPRFGSEPFLKAQRLLVRVQLWPLLTRRLVVEALIIDEPAVRLVRDARGEWNYASLTKGVQKAPGGSGGGGATGGAGGAPPGKPAGTSAAGGGFDFAVHNLRLTKGTLSVSQTGGGAAGSKVKAIELDVTDISKGAIGAFDLSFKLEAGPDARLTGKGLAVAPDRAEIGEFSASLAGSRVSGSCSVSRFERPILDVKLNSPSLDLDEMMSLFPAAGPAPAATSAIRTAADVAVVVPARRQAGSASSAPSLLRDLTVRGDLSVDRIKVMNPALSTARARLTMEGGEARLSGVSVNLYKGSLAGDLSARVTESGPPFTLAASVKGVDFNAFASDLSPGLKGLVYGTFDGSLDLEGRDLDTPGLRRNLGGKGSLALRDGKLTSIAALKMLAKALEAAGGGGIGKDETPFSSLAGTFTVANGVLRTDDLALDSPDLDMNASGKIGLDLSLDLAVSAKLSESVSADMVAKTPNLRYLENKKGKLEVDMTLGGTVMAPTAGVDPRMLSRAAKAAGKEQIQKHGKDLLDRVLKKKKPN